MNALVSFIIKSCVFVASISACVCSADTFVWQGLNRNNVSTLSAWYNQTTGATATSLPSSTDSVIVDFQNSTTESGDPYPYQIITFIRSDFTWGDTIFKNINTIGDSTTVLNKFITQGPAYRETSFNSLKLEASVNPSLLWLCGGDSSTPAKVTVVDSVYVGSASDSADMTANLYFGGNGNQGAGSSGGAIGPVSSVNIGASTYVYGNSAIRFNANNTGSIDSPAVEIKGFVNMISLNEQTPTLSLTYRTYGSLSNKNTYIKIGGLNGTGTIQNELSSGFTNFITILDITTDSTTDAKFSETFLQSGTLGGSGAIDINKYGAGKQTLIIDNDSEISSCNVIVNGGELSLYSEINFKTLTLENGILDIHSKDDIAGEANFNSIHLSDGMLSFGVYEENSYDKLISSGILSANSSDILIDILISINSYSLYFVK